MYGLRVVCSWVGDRVLVLASRHTFIVVKIGGGRRTRSVGRDVVFISEIF